MNQHLENRHNSPVDSGVSSLPDMEAGKKQY